MSNTYVIAARLPLKKKAVTTWLRAPLEPWSGRPDRLAQVDYDAVPTVCHGLAAAADEVVTYGAGLVAAWSGASRAFLVYHVVIGWQPPALARTLDALAAASGHLERKRPTHALLFAETAGRLVTDGVLAAIRLRPGTAEVVEDVDLNRVVEDLRPAEAGWLTALAAPPGEALHDPSILQPAIRQLAQSPALK